MHFDFVLSNLLVTVASDKLIDNSVFCEVGLLKAEVSIC